MDHIDISAKRDLSSAASGNAFRSNQREAAFVPIRGKDLPTFYQQCVKEQAEPLLMDIYEPLIFPSVLEFVEFFEQDALLWRLGPLAMPSAYFALHDVQWQEKLANLDFVYFAAYPAVGSAKATLFWDIVKRADSQAGISRIQSFVLEGSQKIPLLTSFGFKQEGVLREHVFHNGRYHDVIVHAWMEACRG